MSLHTYSEGGISQSDFAFTDRIDAAYQVRS